MHDPLRPTFERSVPGVGPEALAARVAEALAAPDAPLPHRRAGCHFQVWLPDGRRRTWSPWLHVDVNPGPAGGAASTLFGRFTPAPSIWTGFMLAYLALAVIAVGGGLFGYSQWLVEERPWGLWLVPAALAVGLVLLASSRAGQALARDEMRELAAAVERAVESPAAAGSATPRP